MAEYGTHRLTTGTNHEPTPHAGERRDGIPSARPADAARCCQMQATITAATVSRPTTRLTGLYPLGPW